LTARATLVAIPTGGNGGGDALGRDHRHDGRSSLTSAGRRDRPHAALIDPGDAGLPPAVTAAPGSSLSHGVEYTCDYHRRSTTPLPCMRSSSSGAGRGRR
jgi:hypothetical protein